MERIEHIDSKECKGQKTITIHLKGGNEPRLMLSPQVRSSYLENHLLNVSFCSCQILLVSIVFQYVRMVPVCLNVLVFSL